MLLLDVSPLSQGIETTSPVLKCTETNTLNLIRRFIDSNTLPSVDPITSTWKAQVQNEGLKLEIPLITNFALPKKLQNNTLISRTYSYTECWPDLRGEVAKIKIDIKENEIEHNRRVACNNNNN